MFLDFIRWSNKINKKNIYTAIFYIFVFIVPLSQFISVRILFILFIGSLVLYINDTSSIRQIGKLGWDLQVYFFILICGVVYSVNWKFGIGVLETNFSLLAMPVVFGRISLNQLNIGRIFTAFSSGLALACMICLASACVTYYNSGDLSAFYYTDFTDAIGMQPTYMAYYLCFTITGSLYLWNREMSSYYFVIAVTFFFVILMLTGGRTAYVGMIFVFAFFILKYLFERNSAKSMNFYLSMLFLAAMLIVNQFNINTSGSSTARSGDYWERFSLWRSAILANPDILFGVGTGDYKQVLNDYYLDQGMTEYAREGYNSHNQFIQLFFSNGVLGLIGLILIISRPLFFSFMIQNSLGTLLIFLFIIYGVTEVFLGRYQGVVFFALCHQIVISQYLIAAPKMNLVKS